MPSKKPKTAEPASSKTWTKSEIQEDWQDGQHGDGHVYVGRATVTINLAADRYMVAGLLLPLKEGSPAINEKGEKRERDEDEAEQEWVWRDAFWVPSATFTVKQTGKNVPTEKTTVFNLSPMDNFPFSTQETYWEAESMFLGTNDTESWQLSSTDSKNKSFVALADVTINNFLITDDDQSDVVFVEHFRSVLKTRLELLTRTFRVKQGWQAQPKTVKLSRHLISAWRQDQTELEQSEPVIPSSASSMNGKIILRLSGKCYAYVRGAWNVYYLDSNRWIRETKPKMAEHIWAFDFAVTHWKYCDLSKTESSGNNLLFVFDSLSYTTIHKAVADMTEILQWPVVEKSAPAASSAVGDATSAEPDAKSPPAVELSAGTEDASREITSADVASEKPGADASSGTVESEKDDSSRSGSQADEEDANKDGQGDRHGDESEESGPRDEANEGEKEEDSGNQSRSSPPSQSQS